MNDWVNALIVAVPAVSLGIAIVRLGRWRSAGGHHRGAARTAEKLNAEMARRYPVRSAELEAARVGLLNLPEHQRLFGGNLAGHQWSPFEQADLSKVGRLPLAPNLIGRGMSQSSVVRGAGNVVVQSGCIVGGDMVGGDLIKGSSSAGRCKYCGAAQ